MGNMDVEYTTNDNASVVTITVTSSDGVALSIRDLGAALQSVLDKLEADERSPH